MVFSTIVRLSGARRVPLIKFRKGGSNNNATNVNQASASPSSAASSKVTQAAAVSSNAIEDWELPPRYWRKPIDVAEMEYINRGGPA